MRAGDSGQSEVAKEWLIQHEVELKPQTSAQRQSGVSGQEQLAMSPAEATRELLHVEGSRTFFYPASAFDWFHLDHFSERCDTFIYCDWAVTPERLDADLLNRAPGFGLQVKRVTELEPEAITNLADYGVLPHCRRIAERQPELIPWGRRVVITRNGGRSQSLRLFYLAAEGVTVYTKLFAQRQKAPSHLCIKKCGVAYGGNWTNFNDWEEPLGRTIDAVQSKPRYVITDRKFDWPWPVKFERLDPGHGDFYPAWVYTQA